MMPTFDLGNVVRRLIAVSSRVWLNPISRLMTVSGFFATLVTIFNQEIMTAFGAPSWLVYPSWCIDTSTRSDLFHLLGYLLNFSMLSNALEFFALFAFKVVSFLTTLLGTLVSYKIVSASYHLLKFNLKTIT